MAAVYARFKNSQGSWKYEKVGKGRPPKEASFHARFTDATGKRRWSQPFPSVEAANANSDGVKIASVAASKGLTVSEFQDTLNAGKTTIKDAVDQFLRLKKRKRPRTVALYTSTLQHLVTHHVKETGVEYASKLVSVAKPVKQKPRAYSDADIKKLFETMTEEEWERYAFFLSTGCREQEVMYATWD